MHPTDTDWPMVAALGFAAWVCLLWLIDLATNGRLSGTPYRER